MTPRWGKTSHPWQGSGPCRHGPGGAIEDKPPGAVPRRLCRSFDKPMPTTKSIASTVLALCLLAPVTALAQPAAVRNDQAQGEYGCEVQVDTPCQGRVDFEKGRSFEFKIPGPGDVTFHNEGNKRCTLEYSIAESTLAATGRQLSLGPGQTEVMTVRDAGGMIIRFFNRGQGSTTCDLTVGLKG